MDDSVVGVTLYSAFIFDLLEQYKGMDTTCSRWRRVSTRQSRRPPRR